NPVSPKTPFSDRKVCIEEVPDIDDPHSKNRFVHPYPRPVATPLQQGNTQFGQWKEAQEASGESAWAPFENQEEWDLAQWLIKTVGQTSIDEYLKLPIVSCDKVNK
ncbi:hypothetical protein H0H81_006309, partial [Sphagnurus paluster]